MKKTIFIFVLVAVFGLGMADSYAKNTSSDDATTATADPSTSSTKKPIAKPTTGMTCASYEECCSSNDRGCIMCAKTGTCPKK